MRQGEKKRSKRNDCIRNWFVENLKNLVEFRKFSFVLLLFNYIYFVTTFNTRFPKITSTLHFTKVPVLSRFFKWLKTIHFNRVEHHSNICCHQCGLSPEYLSRWEKCGGGRADHWSWNCWLSLLYANNTWPPPWLFTSEIKIKKIFKTSDFG